ncbi:unnamed protein product [Lathyrus oleraceus]
MRGNRELGKINSKRSKIMKAFEVLASCTAYTAGFEVLFTTRCGS